MIKDAPFLEIGILNPPTPIGEYTRRICLIIGGSVVGLSVNRLCEIAQVARSQRSKRADIIVPLTLVYEAELGSFQFTGVTWLTLLHAMQIGSLFATPFQPRVKQRY